MNPGSQTDSSIYTAGFIVERIGQNPRDESLFRRLRRQRPLGVAALEDKIVQQAVVTILNLIYEVDFKGFSYGFRPGRSPHRPCQFCQMSRDQRSFMNTSRCLAI
jgi:hypothetical protein